MILSPFLYKQLKAPSVTYRDGESISTFAACTKDAFAFGMLKEKAPLSSSLKDAIAFNDAKFTPERSGCQHLFCGFFVDIFFH
jgi:hypothetical protein